MHHFATDRGSPEPVPLAGARIIEQVRDQAMFLVDRHGRIASWNEGVGLVLGWDKEDWMGQPLAVAFTPEDVSAGVPETEMRLAARHGRADDDRWMRRRNGEHFFALGALTRMLDDTGELVGYLKALRDYTGPKTAQEDRERLLASEAQARSRAENQAAALTAAFEAIADGVYIGDERGIVRSNASGLALLGVDTHDGLRMDLDELVRHFRLRSERDGELVPTASLPFARALQGESVVMEMWATRRADAKDLFLRCAAAPIRVQRQVAGAVMVCGDLSERLELDQAGRALNRAQTALHERNAELRALVDGVRDYAIYTINPDGRISSWHLGASLMKGYDAAEAIGMPFQNLFTAEERAAGLPEKELQVAARTGEYKGDGLRRRKDGSTFQAAVVLTALRGTRGELLGYLKLTQDISERKQLEREREQMLSAAQQARLDAERASRSKDEFMATVSHELRTPLSAILGWAQALERGTFDADTVKHGLAAISRNARTQVQLIEDLLDMGRIESGVLRLDLQRVELGGVIAAAIDAALPVAAAKGVGLRAVFADPTGAVIGDAARLQQVVSNLLNNGIKFTPEGGQVTVTLTQHDGHAQIDVADTGQGVEPEFLPRLFDRFQQHDASTTRRHGGLGIGLSIVRQLVQLHGGTVQARSLGAGRGTTVTVTVPSVDGVSAAAATAGAGAGGATTPPDGGATQRLDGVSVLLVEDEPDVRVVTQRLLQDAGATVLPAANAEEGLRLLRRHRPSVILSDIGMPDTDGYELLRRVRQLPEAEGGQTPAAAFTAYAGPEDRQRAMAAGFQTHLAKPVAAGALIATLAGLVLQGALHGAG
jgi:PAS domain S-box-containing protein